MTTTVEDGPTTAMPWSAIARRFGVAAAASAAVNLVIFLGASAFGAALEVPESPGSDVLIDLGAGVVAVASVLPLAIATVLAAGLRRLARGARIFTAIVVAALLVSYAPFASSDMTGGTTITLAIMHPVVAAAALWQLRAVANAAGSGRS